MTGSRIGIAKLSTIDLNVYIAFTHKIAEVEEGVNKPLHTDLFTYENPSMIESIISCVTINQILISVILNQYRPGKGERVYPCPLA